MKSYNQAQLLQCMPKDLAAWVLLFSLNSVAAHAIEPISINTDNWDWKNIMTEYTTSVVTEQKHNLEELPRLAPGKAEPNYGAKVIKVKQFYPDSPSFDVIPALKTPSMYPCSGCHDWRKKNPTPRRLGLPHNNFDLQHSLHNIGEFWCFSCHKLDNPDGIKDLEGNSLKISDSYLLCGQCHSRQAKDWVFGAHGKRIGRWNGRRKILDCVACHYQHQPGIKPRAPLAGPVIRTRLSRPDHWLAESSRSFKYKGTTPKPIWQRYEKQRSGYQE